MTKATPATARDSSTARAERDDRDDRDDRDATQTGLITPVMRALKLLRFVADGGSTANMSEVGRRIGVNRVTVMRLLATLEHEGVLEPLPHGGHRLGLGFLTLSAAALAGEDHLATARRVLTRVTSETGLSSYLTVLDGTQVRYLLCETPALPLVSNIRAGSRVTAHLTAPGRSLLAHLSPERRRALLGPEPLAAATAQSARTYAALDAQLARDRETGCAWSQDGFEAGIDACAAAVLDAQGRPLAALSVAGPRSLVGTDTLSRERTAAVVKSGAADLTVLLADAPAFLAAAERA
ncbi:IclR family transcriptional regulator [Pandoraea norimbergensis]|uniref:IclR family transcriptional regulator n=1 Tax=Pandoraea norimbergensis TaxID=93219 RepID=A0ABN4JCE1_9BURK|nr:IclR family transcriptional regulator [Pandoraea norimbergensis]ALS58587.1 IclR family transcriptional regulator [Pandoraea norimbergensis]